MRLRILYAHAAWNRWAQLNQMSNVGHKNKRDQQKAVAIAHLKELVARIQY